MNVRRLCYADKELIIDFWSHKENLWGNDYKIPLEDILKRFNKYFVEEPHLYSVYGFIEDNKIQLAIGSYRWKNAPYFTIFDFAKRSGQKINIKTQLSESTHRLVSDMLQERRHSFYYPMKVSHIAKHALRSEDGINSIESIIPIFKFFSFNIEEIINAKNKTKYDLFKSMVGGVYDKDIIIRRGTLKPKWFKLMLDENLDISTIEKCLKEIK